MIERTLFKKALWTIQKMQCMYSSTQNPWCFNNVDTENSMLMLQVRTFIHWIHSTRANFVDEVHDLLHIAYLVVQPGLEVPMPADPENLD